MIRPLIHVDAFATQGRCGKVPGLHQSPSLYSRADTLPVPPLTPPWAHCQRQRILELPVSIAINVHCTLKRDSSAVNANLESNAVPNHANPMHTLTLKENRSNSRFKECYLGNRKPQLVVHNEHLLLYFYVFTVIFTFRFIFFIIKHNLQ